MKRKDEAHSFARWLGAEAAQTGWSFRELARRSGLSAGALDEVLGSGAGPTWELCARIGHALRLSPLTVFRKAGLLPPIPRSGEERLVEVFDTLANLPEGPIRREAGEAIRAVAEHAHRRAQGVGGSNEPGL